MEALLIDTVLEEVGVFLVREEKVIAERRWMADKKLGNRLLEEIEAVLKEKGVERDNLDRIGVVVGPGKRYMGLRTGIMVANALALAWECGVVEIDKDEGDTLIIQLFSKEVKRIAKPRYFQAKSS
jgi:tRNA threonylcarbamoyl adenosine modification protein YeaZ